MRTETQPGTGHTKVVRVIYVDPPATASAASSDTSASTTNASVIMGTVILIIGGQRPIIFPNESMIFGRCRVGF